MIEDTPQTSEVASKKPIYRSEGKSVFVSFLELFFSRWLLICGIFFSASFWSWYTLMSAPDTFRATGQVLIRRGSIDAVRNSPIMRQQEELGSEVDILKSIAVVDEAVHQLLQRAKSTQFLDRPGDARIFGAFQSTRPDVGVSAADLPNTDPAALAQVFSKQIAIQKFGESNVIELSLVSTNPTFAAEAVNTLIDVYEKYHLSVDQSPGHLAFFERELEEIDVEIDAFEMRLAELKRERGVVDLDKETELLALRRHALRVQLDELQVDKVALQRDLRKIQAVSSLETPFARRDASIQTMRQRLFHEEGVLAELKTHYQIDNPVVVAKLEEVEELRQNLAQELRLVVGQQRHLMEQVLDKEQELQAKIARIDAQLLDFPRLKTEIDRLDRDIQQRTIKRGDLVEQMVKSRTLERRDESLNKVRVLGYAQIPPFAREARKGFKFIVAVMLSLIGSLVVAVFVESLDRSIRRREEIEEQLQLPYLASIGTHSR